MAAKPVSFSRRALLLGASKQASKQVRLVWSKDPEIYVGRAAHAIEVKGDDREKERYHGHQSLGGGVVWVWG